MRLGQLQAPPERALRMILTAIVTLVAGGQLFPWLTADAQTLIGAGHLKDDAFFYTELVDRFRASGVFSLDGSMATNGFQPLWMGLLLTQNLPQPWHLNFFGPGGPEKSND